MNENVNFLLFVSLVWLAGWLSLYFFCVILTRFKIWKKGKKNEFFVSATMFSCLIIPVNYDDEHLWTKKNNIHSSIYWFSKKFSILICWNQYFQQNLLIFPFVCCKKKHETIVVVSIIISYHDLNIHPLWIFSFFWKIEL